MEIQLRNVKESDFEWLYNLRSQTMSDYIDESGDHFTRESQTERIMKEYDSIDIVRLNNQDIGMFKVKREKDSWEIIQIQLLPEYQGSGVGTKLIQNCLKDARIKAIPVYLSVLKVNPAKSLYERLGLNIVEKKEKSYIMRYSA